MKVEVGKVRESLLVASQQTADRLAACESRLNAQVDARLSDIQQAQLVAERTRLRLDAYEEWLVARDRSSERRDEESAAYLRDQQRAFSQMARDIDEIRSRAEAADSLAARLAAEVPQLADQLKESDAQTSALAGILGRVESVVAELATRATSAETSLRASADLADRIAEVSDRIRAIEDRLPLRLEAVDMLRREIGFAQDALAAHDRMVRDIEKRVSSVEEMSSNLNATLKSVVSHPNGSN